MNKQHHTIWNHSTQSWVAVSEITRSQTKKNKLSNAVSSIVIATSALFGSGIAMADTTISSLDGRMGVNPNTGMPGGVIDQLLLTDGSNVAAAANTMTGVSSAEWTYLTMIPTPYLGGTILINSTAGTANSDTAYFKPGAGAAGVYVSSQTNLIVNTNVDIEGFAGFVVHDGATLTVNGNTNVVATGGYGFHGLYNDRYASELYASKADFNGDVTYTGTAGLNAPNQGIDLQGNRTDLTITGHTSIANASEAVTIHERLGENAGAFNSTVKLNTLTATNVINGLIIAAGATGASKITSTGLVDITSTGTAVSAGSGTIDLADLKAMTSGASAFGVAADGTAQADSSRKIDENYSVITLVTPTTKGNVKLGKITSITTSGVGANAINATNGGVIAITGDATLSTSGAGAYGVSATGGSNVTIGGAGTITTTGDEAHGANIKDSDFSIASGDITVSGVAARGITWTNTDKDINLDTKVNITAKGSSSGVHAMELIAQNGSINLVSNGNLTANGAGITAGAQTGNVSITSNGVISSVSTDGIRANTRNGNVNVTSSGAITSQYGSGISANAFETGDVSVSSTAIINAGRSGIQVDSITGNINITNAGAINSGLVAISAFAEDGAASINIINTGALNSVSTGIDAFIATNSQTTTGDIEINNAGDILTRPDPLNPALVASGIRAHTNGSGDTRVINSGNIITEGGVGEYDLNGSEGIFAGSTLGKVSISSAAGKTISAAGNAISAYADDMQIDNASNLVSKVGSGIWIANDNGVSTINNSGDITATTVGQFAIKGANLNTDKVITTAGVLTGDISLGGGNDEFTASGGALVGSTFMGEGDDTTTLKGTVDVSQAPQFDGGLGADVLNIDGLSVRGFTAPTNDSAGNDLAFGNNLTGFETINVSNAGTLKLSKDLFTASTLGELNIDATSTLDLKGNSPGVFSIFGNVNNSGIMTQADGAADDVTTITGNYTGVAGSQYHIDTVLGADNSATDKLIINGNSAGTTKLVVTNAGGTGAQTVEGIQVVQVDGTSAGTFTLAAPVQAGAYEYALFKNGVSTPTDGDWYLRSTITNPDCSNTPSLPGCGGGGGENCSNTPSLCPPIYIYRPAIAAYVVAQAANADTGFALLSTLHERMGEQKGLTTDQAQTWGRAFGSLNTNEGHNRFGYEQTTSGFQFGRDLLHTTNSNGTQQRAGVTIQYANGNVDVSDSVRPMAGLDLDTGSIRSTTVGLGGYYTNISQNGTYLDVVGQANHLKNKFYDSYGGKANQSAWQMGLSTEIGKPFAFGNGFQIEPQAQLSYLYTDYSDFSDALSRVDGDNLHSLRARLGARLTKDVVIDGNSAQYYAIANINHDIIGAKSVTANDLYSNDGVLLREDFDKTTAELGAGIQGQVGKSTYVYADARYERSFKGNKDAAKFNIGLKSSF